jgi:predicted ArsR family transcriptional regulator
MNRQPLFKSIYIDLNRIFGYNQPMQFTRKQIIDYLDKHQKATARGLSLSLSMTIGNVRHHLKELESQNVVEEIGTLPPEGRGRPTKLYGLTREALSHNLDDLSTALLKGFFMVDRLEGIDDRYEAVVDVMTAGFDGHPNLVQRFNQVITWLNQHNYRARWEASETGPRIILGHCPYFAVLGEVPEICRLDASILSRLIGVPFDQTELKSRVNTGADHCKLTLR